MTTTLTLTDLLGSSPSSAFALAYALPLFFLSILLTFAGTFLTLDRTRSFPHASYKAIPGSFDTSKKRFAFALEGGVGGLALGYAFGVQLATFLAVCIPALTSASPLSSKSFIAVWLLPSVVTTFLGGRWKYCALAFGGITGGALFAMGLSVIIHPSLLTRVVLTAIFAPILTILTLLPLERCQHPALRFATASTGAFGMVMTIAILADIPAWANVWQRLAQADNIEWGTSREQGLSAAFCILMCMGMVSDFFLRRKFGECPDEKWDHYLASYAANLPNQVDRAGTFQPLQSMWDRVLHGKPSPKGKEIIFPDEEFQDTKYPIPSTPTSPTKLHKLAAFPPAQSQFHLNPECLKKPRGQPRLHGFKRKPREAVKFRPLGDANSDSDSEDELDKPPPQPTRPWLRPRPSLASTHTANTLVDDYEQFDPALEKIKINTKKGTDTPDYSDYEEDVTATKEWQAGLLAKRSGSLEKQRSASGGGQSSATLSAGTPPLGAVPATPSLIKALDRIKEAQKVAFVPDGMPRMASSDGRLSPKRQGPATSQKEHWDGFWKDVRDQAKL